MRWLSAILLALLLASNAAWLVFRGVGSGDEAPEHASALADLRAQVRMLEASREALVASEAEAARAAKARLEGIQSEAAERPETRRREPPPSRSSASRPSRSRAGRSSEAARVAQQQVDAWKADILQTQDEARREAGLVALGAGIQSNDNALAVASLKTLHALRDAAYDKARFREGVRLRLEDEAPQVRRAAAFALLQVDPEAEDADRLVRVAEAHPEETGLLIVGAWLAENRIEGRLADLYVEALSTDDTRAAVSVANQLRGLWVSADVEEAVLAAYRRGSKSAQGGLWLYVLGQMRPTREARVRLLFEILKTASVDAPQLLSRALIQGRLDPFAKALAADLALETLPEAPNALTRRLCLRVLEESGTAAHADGVRAYADNPMVAEKLRKEAAQVARKLERR